MTIRRYFRTLAVFLACMTSLVPATADNTKFVNLFIGTGGHGHTHPAAVVPHGMVQPGPDTRWSGWDACSGYHYSDSTINGFAYTRLSGTGCADFGDFLIMPVTGVGISDFQAFGAPGAEVTPWASTFSHADEQAEPGYYAVSLPRYGVKAEMTATERAAIHRFSFPQGRDAALILDLNYAIQDQVTLDADVEIVDSVTVRARRRTWWWAYNQEVYFYARFSQPFQATVCRDSATVSGRRQPVCRVLLQFPNAEGSQLLMRAAISAVDADGARLNLQTEIPHWDFDGVRRSAHDKWVAGLDRIDITPVQGPEADTQRTIFYTALYHAAIAPSIFSDADGRYRGMDLTVRQGNPAEPNYTVFSLWDTFRALHPLTSILAPDRNEAYIRTLIRKADEGGCVPKWDCASNYTACMPGYHFASLVADAWVKGYRHFDAEKALRACLKLAEGDTSGLSPVIPKYKVKDLLPEGRRLKNQLGYIPCDKEVESVAKALEYAYDDWCIATLADSLGQSHIARRYHDFANGWRRYFDPSIRFMRGVDSQGEWRTPFDPRRSEHRADDYCEGTAWQWTWFVPHDVPGLIDAMGGAVPFVGKLDSLFTAPSELTGDLVSADISGLIGQYAHGNEPGHHIIYLYNYAGRPERTQALCDSVLRTLYAAAPEGLAGNEDCGQMSAWYILSAMGIYQVCPGTTQWTIGRPLFSKAEITLPSGRQFTIVAENNSPEAKYVTRATLNGKVLSTPFLSHADITAGGTLVLTMSPTPPVQ